MNEFTTGSPGIRLREIITELGTEAVAYSGGSDGAYLLTICLDVLGTDHVIALMAASPLIPRAELAEAHELALQSGTRHQALASDGLGNPNIVANPPDCCYHCKFSRFETFPDVAHAEGLAHLIHGENADDAGDYRPSSRAAEELGIRAPLRQAGLTKVDVRTLSREQSLPTWNKRANARLASRFPYGTPLTTEGMAREAVEVALHNAWGLRQIRVRDHFPVARPEVPPAEIGRLAQPEARAVAVEALCGLGCRSVSMDLAGYRMESLNDDLDLESTRSPSGLISTGRHGKVSLRQPSLQHLRSCTWD